MEKWRGSTLTEYYLAVAGYWRNWERQTGWLMRELVFAMVQGNPYIKQENKPGKEEILKLSIDQREEPKGVKKLSKEEIEAIRLELLEKLNK